jgi:tyrosinase
LQTREKGAFTMINRKNAGVLTKQEQDNFLNAINQLNAGSPPTPYAEFVAIHADMRHRMHIQSAGAVGRQRFLPWHRDFLLKFEQALQTITPTVFVPYWNWSVDQKIPQWLTNITITVEVPAVGMNPPSTFTITPRNGNVSGLPTEKQIKQLISGGRTYTQFAGMLEAYHDTVHNAVGDVMGDIMYSPCDPLFWLHHAEVDRIWSVWQADPANKNKGPLLAGMNAILDPWAPDTIATIADIGTLGYQYV